MLLDDISGEQVPNSDISNGDRKRKRKSLSCFDCRRRKLRCDREVPCGRCRKAGHPETCVYNPESLPNAEISYEDSHSTTQPPERNSPPIWNTRGKVESLPIGLGNATGSTEDVVSKVRRQAERIAQLESRVASLEGLSQLQRGRESIHGTISPAIHRQEQGEESETMFFKGKAFRTQFYGASNATSILAHFPQVRSFMDDVITKQTHNIHISNDFRALRAKGKNRKPRKVDLADNILYQLVPDRADYLARLYFGTFERTYRVLHAPTFWASYDSFRHDPSKSKPQFIVILILLIAAVSCIDPERPEGYVGSSSLARENAHYWIRVGECWLRRHSKKHLTMEYFQVHCLLFLAKQANSIKRKQAWTSAGDMMRISVAAGLHRDPDLLGKKVSIFEREMRRRLWATIMELELQASVARGIPSSLAGLSFDCPAPTNLNDDDFDVDTEHGPVPRSRQEYTDTSFLHLAWQSLPLRVTLNSAINDLGTQLTYDYVLAESQKIMDHLADVPQWEGIKSGRLGQLDTTVPRFLLDIQLRQFLIWLHCPLARRNESSSQVEYSRMVCLNAASTILDRHFTLVAEDNHLLKILRNDIYFAGLSICHNLFVSAVSGGDSIFRHLGQSLCDVVSRALELFEDKTLRLGEGYENHWLASTAHAVMRCQILKVDPDVEKLQAIERLTRTYYKVLTFQKSEGEVVGKEIIESSDLNHDFGSIGGLAQKHNSLVQDPKHYHSAPAMMGSSTFTPESVPEVLPFDVNAQMQPLSFEELAQWDIGGDLWAFNL